MEVFAVIMAGGVGARFWPRSRKEKPKQLIRIIGENTMIQDTVARLDGIIKKENILIITNKIQKPRIKSQLPEIPEENIIDEPFGKNTAPCIGLASAIVRSRSKDAITVTLPADHLIIDIQKFQSTLKTAIEHAKISNDLVTIGIKPTRPETGYGYIQIDDEIGNTGIYKVINFAEKPNIATAAIFVESGDFMWNSGMFIWKVDAIIEEFRIYMSDLYDGILKIEKAIGKPDFETILTQVYGELRSISIDYGIMEKSENVSLTKGEFDWNDVGNWDAVYNVTEEKDQFGNANIGDVYVSGVQNSYVFSPHKFTAVIGVENIVVINTNDALLVCNRNNVQEVKEVVDYLKFNKKYDLL